VKIVVQPFGADEVRRDSVESARFSDARVADQQDGILLRFRAKR
jgi:hypothetical protein